MNLRRKNVTYLHNSQKAHFAKTQEGDSLLFGYDDSRSEDEQLDKYIAASFNRDSVTCDLAKTKDQSKGHKQFEELHDKFKASKPRNLEDHFIHLLMQHKRRQHEIPDASFAAELFYILSRPDYYPNGEVPIENMIDSKGYIDVNKMMEYFQANQLRIKVPFKHFSEFNKVDPTNVTKISDRFNVDRSREELNRLPGRSEVDNTKDLHRTVIYEMPWSLLAILAQKAEQCR